MAMLRRSARRGHLGYPIAAVAFDVIDDQRASKVAFGIVRLEEGEPELKE